MQFADHNIVAFRFTDSLKVYEISLKVYKKDDSCTKIPLAVREGQVAFPEDIDLGSSVDLYVTVSKYIKDSDLTALFEWIVGRLPEDNLQNNVMELRTYCTGPESETYVLSHVVPPEIHRTPYIQKPFTYEFAELMYRTPRVKWSEVSTILYAKNPKWLPEGQSTQGSPIGRVFEITSTGLYCLLPDSERVCVFKWEDPRMWRVNKSLPEWPAKRRLPNWPEIMGIYNLTEVLMKYVGGYSPYSGPCDRNYETELYENLRGIGVIPERFCPVRPETSLGYALRGCQYYIQQYAHENRHEPLPAFLDLETFARYRDFMYSVCGHYV